MAIMNPIRWEITSPLLTENNTAESHCSVCQNPETPSNILAHRISPVRNELGHRIHANCLLAMENYHCPQCRVTFNFDELPISYLDYLRQKVTLILNSGKESIVNFICASKIGLLIIGTGILSELAFFLLKIPAPLYLFNFHVLCFSGIIGIVAGYTNMHSVVTVCSFVSKQYNREYLERQSLNVRNIIVLVLAIVFPIMIGLSAGFLTTRLIVNPTLQLKLGSQSLHVAAVLGKRIGECYAAMKYLPQIQQQRWP